MKAWINLCASLSCLSMLCLAQGPSPGRARARDTRAADDSLRAGNYDLAISSYKEFLKREPHSAAIWSNYGAALFGKGDALRASGAFVRAAQLEPRSPEYAFNAALALVRLDKCGMATSYFEVARRATAHAPAVSYLNGVCAFVAKQWKRAESLLLQAYGESVISPETYYMLTIAAHENNDRERSSWAYLQLKNTYPESPLVQEALSEIFDDEYDTRDAIREISDAIAAHPNDPGLHGKLAFLLWKEGQDQWPRARALFSEELALDRHSYPSMHYLGVIAEQSNQYDVALDWYQRALRERPNLGEAHFAIGRVLERKGEDVEALREFQASLPALKGDISLHYWTARALRRMGRNKDASHEFASVAAINKATRDDLLRKLMTAGAGPDALR